MRDVISAVEFSHQLISDHVLSGSVVVDATVGNGNDTVFLAELVGVDGFVYGFDIQQDALDKTAVKLKKANLTDRVKLYHSGHEKMTDYFDKPVNGILFNLGYLPGGDKSIVTRKETTIQAVNDGLDLLDNEGIIVLVIYTGHPGGREERDLLLKMVADLDNKEYNVLNYKFLNQLNSPEVLAIKKRG